MMYCYFHYLFILFSIDCFTTSACDSQRIKFNIIFKCVLLGKSLWICSLYNKPLILGYFIPQIGENILIYSSCFSSKNSFQYFESNSLLVIILLSVFNLSITNCLLLPCSNLILKFSLFWQWGYNSNSIFFSFDILRFNIKPVYQVLCLFFFVKIKFWPNKMPRS